MVHDQHEQMFRGRFWVCLVLSIPVLLFSQTLQSLLGFSMPVFPGSQWIEVVFAVAIFLYGGVPFLQMAVPELNSRQPGMMTLISLAISVAFVYSVAVLFLDPTGKSRSMIVKSSALIGPKYLLCQILSRQVSWCRHEHA